MRFSAAALSSWSSRRHPESWEKVGLGDGAVSTEQLQRPACPLWKLLQFLRASPDTPTASRLKVSYSQQLSEDTFPKGVSQWNWSLNCTESSTT